MFWLIGEHHNFWNPRQKIWENTWLTYDTYWLSTKSPHLPLNKVVSEMHQQHPALSSRPRINFSLGEGGPQTHHSLIVIMEMIQQLSLVSRARQELLMEHCKCLHYKEKHGRTFLIVFQPSWFIAVKCCYNVCNQFQVQCRWIVSPFMRLYKN